MLNISSAKYISSISYFNKFGVGLQGKLCRSIQVAS